MSYSMRTKDKLPNEHSIDALGNTRRKMPGWRRAEDIPKGYTGFCEKLSVEDSHILDEPMKKVAIRGYSGFKPNTQDLFGVPRIPSIESQLRSNNVITETEEDLSDRFQSLEDRDISNFRQFAKHMDIVERYAHAISKLSERGQTPEMLLRLVQAKLSGRVNSSAKQLITLRKLFQAYDFDNSGDLDENEFHECLEKCNIQLDDVQTLALFSSFDRDYNGSIDWNNFAHHAMVPNPKGGTAVLPKVITDRQDCDPNAGDDY